MSDQEKIVATLLQLVADKGWDAVDLMDVAHTAGLNAGGIYRLAPGKSRLIGLLIDEINQRAFDLMPAEPGSEREPERDRLFDAVMRRFDAMVPERDALRVLYYDLRRDPKCWPVLRAGALRSLGWIFDEADIRPGPLERTVRIRVLGWALLQTFRVWLEDGPDQSKTMADLDRRLRRMDRWARHMRPYRRRGVRRRSEDPDQAPGDRPSPAGPDPQPV